MPRSGLPQIRYRWTGRDDEAPMAGHWLASDSLKAKKSYLILNVDDRGARGSGLLKHRLLILTVDRRPIDAAREALAGGETVYTIRWDSRKPKRRQLGKNRPELA